MLFKYFNMLLRLGLIVSALFAFNAAVYSQCVITTINTVYGSCETGDVYSVTGDITIANPPAGGTLTIEVDNGTAIFDTIILPPFLATYNFSVSNIPSNGAASTVNAFFSADPGCAIGPLLFNAPVSCACVAEVGTFSSSIPGGSTNTFSLCFGNVLQLSSNNDFTPPNEVFNPSGAVYDPNIAWLVYSCPPTIGLTPTVPNSLTLDPCLVGFMNMPSITSSTNSVIGAYPAGTFTDNTVYFVPITMYNAAMSVVSFVNTSLPCYETGPVHTVQYLPEFIFNNVVEDCIAGTAIVTVNGGLPEIDGSNFIASNLQPATAIFANTTAPDGGTIQIAGLNGGDLWSFDVTDASGCIETITGGPFPPRDDPGFLYPNGTTFCNNDGLQNPTITGVAGGNFTSTPAGLTMNANSGEINPATSSAGTYDVTYTTPNLCFDDSTVTITINAVPTVDPIADQTICVNQAFNDVNFTGSNIGAVYDWTNDNSAIGQPLSGAGDILSFTPPAGATNLAANFLVTPIANGCAGVPENFTLTLAPNDDASFTIDNLLICADAINPQTAITGLAGGVFTFAATAGGPLLSIDANTGAIDVALSNIGSYDVVYTTAGICPASSTVSLDVLELPTVDPIVDQIICDTDAFAAINFTGSNAGTAYNWTNDNAATGIALAGVGNIMAFTPPVVAATEVSNIIVTPVLNGCNGITETFVLTVQSTDDPSFIIDNLVLCQNDNNPVTSITGNVGGLFSFVPAVGGAVLDIDAATGAIDLANSNAGGYDITYATSGNCPASSTLNISILELPVLAPISDQSVCEGEPLVIQNFSASAGATFSWNNVTGIDVGFGIAGNGQIGSTIGVNNTTDSVSALIEVTPVSAAGCIGLLQTFFVTVNKTPAPSFNTDVFDVCTEDNVTFFNTTPVMAGQTFLWDFGNATSTDIGNAIHSYDFPGSKDVSLTVTSAQGCIASIAFLNYINVTARPVANFSFDDSNLNASNPVIEFINESTGANSYAWDFGDGSDITIFEEPIHEFPNTTGTYTVQLWAYADNPECKDSIKQTIKINEGIFFFIPNVFTPQDGGTNNTFSPAFSDGVDPYEFSLTIFNRWGEIIFRSFNKEVGWDGRYGSDNRLVSTGTYVWKVDFKDRNRPGTQTVSGHVTVLR